MVGDVVPVAEALALALQVSCPCFPHAKGPTCCQYLGDQALFCQGELADDVAKPQTTPDFPGEPLLLFCCRYS